jgi:hypothetical protein
VSCAPAAFPACRSAASGTLAGSFFGGIFAALVVGGIGIFFYNRDKFGGVYRSDKTWSASTQSPSAGFSTF